MDREDPISHFFPGEDDVDLYQVLGLKSDATAEDIRKAYRKLALLCHPDKHTNSSEEERASASTQFQKIGFAYAVLGDEKRRKKFDRTGTTDEGLGLEADEDGGWGAYFEDLFDRVTRGRLDEMKKEYQGSAEEVQDLKVAYLETEGSLDEIMKAIPHSTIDDEPRFIGIISDLIRQGELSELPLWQSSSKDEKAKLVRRKQSDKEANEAEELAKDLGVWDEFYGSGKLRKRRGQGKAKSDDEDGGDEDHSTLQALIVQRQKARNGFLDNLEAKYTAVEESSSSKGVKGKKRKAAGANKSGEEETSSPKKKSRTAPAPTEDVGKTQQALGKESNGSPTKRSTRIKKVK